MEGNVYLLTLIKRSRVAYSISNKRDFEAKNPALDKEGNFIIIKGTIYLENIRVLNVYDPKNRNSKHTKNKLEELQEVIN